MLVREGDVVGEDAPLLEVETDKATVEIPSPFGGRVEKIHVRPGQTVKVGQVLVSFGEARPRPAQAPRRPRRPGPALAPEPNRGRRRRRRRRPRTDAGPAAPSVRRASAPGPGVPARSE